MTPLFVALLLAGAPPSQAGLAFTGLERLVATPAEVAGSAMDGNYRYGNAEPVRVGSRLNLDPDGYRALSPAKAGAARRGPPPPAGKRRGHPMNWDLIVLGGVFGGVAAAALLNPIGAMAVGALAAGAGMAAYALGGLDAMASDDPIDKGVSIGGLAVMGLGIAACFFPPAALAVGALAALVGAAALVVGVKGVRE